MSIVETSGDVYQGLNPGSLRTQDHDYHPFKTSIGVFMLETLKGHRADAERKAWDSLARYKFLMAGYWMAKWVGFNQVLKSEGHGDPNPFAPLVRFSRERLGR